MKRLIITLAALMGSVLAFSRNIGMDEAVSYAAKVLNTSVSNLEIVWTGTNPGSTPAVYAINSRKGGFVIISGKDCVNPVLGYSYEGKFQHVNMPSNIAAYFSSLERDIRMADERHLAVNEADRGLWNIAESGTKASYPASASLTTATWNQGTPYNMFCTWNKQYCPTGCVATAMAIIYRFHSHPAKGAGSVPAYNTKSLGLSVKGIDLSKESFQWSSMPLNDSEVQSASQEKKQAIARLMQVCGTMVQMDYTYNSSGAFTFSVPKVTVENMGYDASSIMYAQKGTYPASQWIDMIKTEVSSNRPVMYAAQSSSGGGHEFVIDGYDNKGYFHLNWGWGGSDNGYFSLELAVSSYRFCDDQEAVFGIKPAAGQQSAIRDYLFLEGEGMKIKSGALAKDQKVSFSINRIANFGSEKYNGAIRLAIVDKNGKVKEATEAEDVEIDAPSIHGYYSPKAFDVPGLTFSCAIDFADKCVIQYKNTSTGEFVDMPYNRETGTRGYLIPVTYNFIKADAAYKIGDVFDFELISGSNYNSVAWFYDGVENKDAFVCLLKAGTHKVKAVITTDAGTETITHEIVVK